MVVPSSNVPSLSKIKSHATPAKREDNQELIKSIEESTNKKKPRKSVMPDVPERLDGDPRNDPLRKSKTETTLKMQSTWRTH